MFFRVWILGVIICLGSLFTLCWPIGCFILLLLFAMPVSCKTSYERQKQASGLSSNSLSYGIKSMKKQKRNFLIINMVFSNTKLLNDFFKKLSLSLDDIYIKTTGNVQNISCYDSHSDDYNAPEKSYLPYNIYHSND